MGVLHIVVILLDPVGVVLEVGKKQVELKILIMTHRCQMCNKKSYLKKISSIGGRGGGLAIEDTSSIFFYLNP